MTADNPAFALIKDAFFAKRSVYLGVRDFGYDSQAGIERIIIERVSVYHI